MSVIFADTLYWIALTNSRDAQHRQAAEFALHLGATTVVTTEHVLVEYLNYFSGWGAYWRSKALSNTDDILSSTTAVVLARNGNSFSSGLDLYRARPDKGYSLTDCISMSVMRQEGIRDVLTNDAHFVQEGFNALFHD